MKFIELSINRLGCQIRYAVRLNRIFMHCIKICTLIPVRYIVHMKTLTYTAARENLAQTMQEVCDDHVPVIITRRRDQAVVLMSLDDYHSLEETAYLLRSPRNARRLRDAVDQLRADGGTERKLPDLA